MESQNLTEKVIVHNLNPEETTGLDPSRQYRDIPNPYQIPDIQQSVEEFIKPTEITPEPIKTPEVKKETKPVKIDNKLIAWCMPASIREEVNPLYGEIKRSIVYGDKFSFEIIVINRNIVSAEFWTNIVIEKNSIIYLWDQREWWRVTKTTPHNEGNMLTCYPSDHHPSF
jgi:hypothetical protein